jgi:hypothetical protein
MARAAGAYVVRDDDAGAQRETRRGTVDKLFPYTLRGLTDALEEARFRSFAGPPQLVLVAAEAGLKVIRRFDHGREAPAADPSG